MERSRNQFGDAVTQRGGLFVCVFLAAALLWAAGGCDEQCNRPSVVIRQRRWFVELATTDWQRYRGLSGRDKLAEDQGMLFIYPRSRVRTFCMRGCQIPLDVAFIGPDRRIVAMYTMQVEPDRAGRVAYSSGSAVQFVLEVRGGALRAAGVSIGDKVLFCGDIPDAAKADPGP